MIKIGINFFFNVVIYFVFFKVSKRYRFFFSFLNGKYVYSSCYN